MADTDPQEAPSSVATPSSPPTQDSTVGALVEDKSSLPENSSLATSSPAPISAPAPQPKRFNSVNINKAFLQKASSASSSPVNATSIANATGATQAKIGNVVVRPTPQHPSPVSSRLITTKLTTGPIGSTAVGSPANTSWLRPSPSGSPSNAAVPTGSGQQTPISGAVSGKSLLTAPSKVLDSTRKNGNGSSSVGNSMNGGSIKSSKAAWSSVSTTAKKVPDVRAQNDFPTAAEVAQGDADGRTAKLLNTQLAAEAAATQKQSMNSTADTFRGVHLDPNAHHWDEMEDEDNDFLGGVIEFADGKSYTIPAGTASPPNPPPLAQQDSDSVPSQPVSKEDRFADDFDRSWPRSSPGASVHRELHPGAKSSRPTSSSSSRLSQAPPLSPSQESTRALFNERSNRLEPYGSNSSQMPNATGRSPRHYTAHLPSANGVTPVYQSGDSQQTHKGFGRNGIPGPPRGFGADRDADRGRRETAPSFGRERPQGERDRDFERGRRDNTILPLMPTGRPRSRERSSRRDVGARLPGSSFHHGEQSNSLNQLAREQSRRQSSFGAGTAPALPSFGIRDRSQDPGRQPPPHLSQVPLSPLGGLQGPRVIREPFLSPPSSAHPSVHSPALSLLSLGPESAPAVTQMVSALPTRVFDDETTKLQMHDAAERARKRRQEEEAEREREKERARKKAVELEERMKKDAAEKEEREKLERERVEKETADQVQEERREQERGLVEKLAKVEHRLKDAERSATRTRTVDSSRREGQHARHSDLPPSRPTFPSRQSSGRGGLFSPHGPGRPLLPSTLADSWRNKAPAHVSSPQSLPSLPSITPLDDPFTVRPGETLEVFDFSEIGKMVGEEPSSPNEVASTPSSPLTSFTSPLTSKLQPRAMASDPFSPSESARVHPTPSKSEIGSWRRPTIGSQELNSSRRPREAEDHLPVSKTLATGGQSISSPRKDPSLSLPAFNVPSATPSKKVLDHSQTQYAPPTSSGRSPRMLSDSSKPYREAPMSTIDDAMFRFRVAMMQSQDSKDSVKGKDNDEPVETAGPEAFVQSSLMAMRSKPAGVIAPRDASCTEKNTKPTHQTRFVGSPIRAREAPWEVTSFEPPRSPPTRSSLAISLPNISTSREPLSKKQVHHLRQPQAIRWDILTWDPPIKDMSKRTLSLDELLFKKIIVRGTIQYRVALPRARLTNPRASYGTEALSTPPRPFGLLSRVSPSGSTPSSSKARDGMSSNSLWPSRRGADEPSWRKPTISTPKLSIEQKPVPRPSLGHLNTVSRSPPPEPPTPASATAANGKSKATSPRSESPAASQTSLQSRSRSQPKMPTGTDVAFYRQAIQDPEAGVKFTVSSELEMGEDTGISEGSRSETSGKSTAPALTENQSKTSQESRNHRGQLATPPPSSIVPGNAWGKSPLSFPVIEPPSKTAPDPEHLKIVWSQGTERETAATENSLKGIADDFPTVIPLSVQDMKSEDGDTQKDTPPPTTHTTTPASITATRMSMHDAHRAFQQVPPSPQQSSAPAAGQQPARLASLSQSMMSPLHLQRQHSMPLANTSLRPYTTSTPYPQTHNHPGSPGMMYAQPNMYQLPPNPGRMPPTWMPMTTSLPQGSFVRATGPPTPYLPQMIAYPPAIYPTMPPPPPPPSQQQPQSKLPATNHLSVRGRGMSMVSPVMSHAHPTPMFNTTAVDHSMAMGTPGHYPVAPGQHMYSMTVGTGRGMVRTGFEQIQHNQHQHNPGMYPVASPPFARQW